MPRIYLSYRRSDHPGMAGRIADELSRAFGREQVVAGFGDPPPGMSFLRYVEQQMRRYDTVLVVIGPRWLTAQNQYGFSNLFDPGDFVRLEIEAALESGKTVIPVLLNDTSLPGASHLPGSLSALASFDAVVIREGADFAAGMKRLVERLGGRAAESGTVQPADGSHHIFLSYSRKDTPVMRRIADDLRQAGLTVWVDDNLEPGTSAWERSISAAIRSAACLVVILSPDAEQSTWVGRELAMAETLDKRIFPILARGSERDAIPIRLMSHQWIDARHNYQEGFGKLLGAVRKYLNLT